MRIRACSSRCRTVAFASRERLPRQLVSHVRLRPGSRDGVGVLDATLADEQGRVVAEIEGYVVKAVDPQVLKGGRKTDGGASPLERWVEQGILPDEGFDLLGRVIAPGPRSPGARVAARSPRDDRGAAHAGTTRAPAPRRADVRASGERERRSRRAAR